jgi:GT2 family glycosyltransferase
MWAGVALTALWQPFEFMERSAPLVILVAYRNTSALRDALASLRGELDVLVVDNDADEEVRELVTAAGSAYVSPGSNVGFAAAVNIGLEQRVGRDVLLVNPDARVTPEAAAALHIALRDDRSLCAVAPQLVGSDGLTQRVEWPIPSPREEWVKAFRLQRFFPARETFLAGAVLMLRSEALDEVGSFDEQFFLYAEECDWQLRAQRRSWRVRVVEGVVAEHSGGGSSTVESRRQEHFHESAELFAVKWHGRRGWRSMRAASRIGASVRLLLTLSDADRREHYARQVRL